MKKLFLSLIVLLLLSAPAWATVRYNVKAPTTAVTVSERGQFTQRLRRSEPTWRRLAHYVALRGTQTQDALGMFALNVLEIHPSKGRQCVKTADLWHVISNRQDGSDTEKKGDASDVSKSACQKTLVLHTVNHVLPLFENGGMPCGKKEQHVESVFDAEFVLQRPVIVAAIDVTASLGMPMRFLRQRFLKYTEIGVPAAVKQNLISWRLTMLTEAAGKSIENIGRKAS